MLAPPIVLLRTLSQRLYARLTKAVQRKQTHSQSTVTWKSTWKLVLINTGTCCVLYAAGDFCRQKIESNHDSTDWYRTGRMGLLGCCLGPLDSLWYTALDRFLPAVTAAAVARKVLLDQLIMAPICCTLFYLGMSAMEGCNRQESVQELKIKFWPTYKMDWQVWPIAQIFNFYLIPPHLRVTYVASVTFLWTVYLSYMKHKKMPSAGADTLLIH